MTLNALLLIMTIHAFALISPGPDFAVVTRLSIVSGRKTGLWCAAGVAAAIGVYVLVTAMGISLVLAALPGLSRLLAVVGAFYLGWLGVQCLRSRGSLPEAKRSAQGKRAFFTGMLTNLLNPKAMLYFSAILSQAFTPGLGYRAIATLWLLLVGESFLWFALVAVLFSAKPLLDWLRGRLIWLDRAVGCVLLALAAKVAMLAAK